VILFGGAGLSVDFPPIFLGPGRRAGVAFACEVTMLGRVGPIEPWLAVGVVASTAATDAVYVMFTSAVMARRRVQAANWSSAWYLLSAFAVISYTQNWVYVCFAAVGSWLGAYASVTFLQRGRGRGGEAGRPIA
jgi:uncharacterized membrane protein YhaH (DUF805 family)